MSFPASVRATAILLTVVAVSTLAAAPAPADEIANKRAEAERIAAELARENRHASMVTEDLNAARIEADRVQRELDAAEQQAARAAERVQLTETQLRRQAADAYIHGGSLHTVAVLVHDPNELKRFPVRAQYVRSATSVAIDTLDALREERARMNERRVALADARRAATMALEAVQQNQRVVEESVARQRAALARAQGELAELVAAEQRRRAEEEARRVQAALEARRREAAAREAAAREAARTAPRNSGSSSAVDDSVGAGPAAAGADVAIAEARKQLGKPYEYGAAGPDSFDCSGLTQWAWKAAGRYLPHSSRAQWSATSRVGAASLQPGDLVFYGPSVSGIHHVGLFVGDGKMIEASETGTPVRYASVYRRDLLGGGRVNY